MRVRTRAAVAAAVALLLLSGCAGDPAAEEEPEPEVLSATKAGGLYLSAVCPVNQAWDEFDVEVDRLRIAQARGERDTDAFSEAMLAVGEASERAAKQLEPKDKTWPTGAVDEVEAVRDSLRADAKQAEKVAELPIEKATVYVWKDLAEVGRSAAEAREVLGLPADPVAACAQWGEQQAAEDTGGTEADEKSDEKSETKSDEKSASSSGENPGEGSQSKTAAN